MTERSEEDGRAQEEAEAAAKEAGSIGGSQPDYRTDDAHRAVAEGGGGESEGFEQSEEALERNASHEDRGGNPAQDAFTVEADRSGAEYGEADETENEDE